MNDNIYEANDDSISEANATTARFILAQPTLGGACAEPERADLQSDVIQEEVSLDPSYSVERTSAPVTVRIIPALDYVDGVLYLAATFEGRRVLITSRRQCIPFEELGAHHIELKTPWPDTCSISEAGIRTFLDGAEEIDGYQLFMEIKSHLERFSVFKDPYFSSFLPVEIMSTYLTPVFPYCAYVYLQGEKNSGKSVALELLEPLVFNGWRVDQPSMASVRQYVHVNAATVLWDEADTIRGADVWAELRAGCKRGAKVPVMVHGKLVEFSFHSTKFFAGREDIDDVSGSRFITGRMIRKLPTEKVEHYRSSPAMREFEQATRDKLTIFALQQAPNLGNSFDERAEILESLGLYNRTFDIWAPSSMTAMIVDDYCPGNSPVVFDSVFRFYLEHEHRRQQRELSGNTTVQLLMMLNNFVEDYPEKLTMTEGGFDVTTEDMFTYAKNEGVVSPQHHKKWLTQHFADLGIHIRSKRTPGDVRKKFYHSDMASHEELCRRYLPTI